MKSTITKRTYRAMYRLLDRVSPVDYDCGTLCDAACCCCSYEPEDIEFTAEGDDNAENYMGIYLLPGEEEVHDGWDVSWIDWGSIMAEDYEYPESWQGKVYFVQCKTPPLCPREHRPIQCRTFPLAPHITEDGEFHIILSNDELPYTCPLIKEEREEHVIDRRFIQATYTVWKRLIEDPYIYDLVDLDSAIREEENREIIILK